MNKLRFRVALTGHRTTVCQTEPWSQFRTGEHVVISGERPCDDQEELEEIFRGWRKVKRLER